MLFLPLVVTCCCCHMTKIGRDHVNYELTQILAIVDLGNKLGCGDGSSPAPQEVSDIVLSAVILPGAFILCPGNPVTAQVPGSGQEAWERWWECER